MGGGARPDEQPAAQRCDALFSLPFGFLDPPRSSAVAPPAPDAPPLNHGTGAGPFSPLADPIRSGPEPAAAAASNVWVPPPSETVPSADFAPLRTWGDLQPASVEEGGLSDPDTGLISVVISEVFGGGSASGPYNRDFVELYNQGPLPVDLTGWSVQTASATSGTWTVTALSGTLAPGQYHLVAFGPVATDEFGNPVGTTLPTPNKVNALVNLDPANGKVLLSYYDVAAEGTQPGEDDGAVDLVGYGTANGYEGSAATSIASSKSATRGGGGDTDTDDNAADFSSQTPTPSNSSSFNPSHANSAPVAFGPEHEIAAPGTSIVFSIDTWNSALIDDLDAAGEPVEATLSVANGTLTLASTAGLTFTVGDGTADATIQVRGTVYDINSALDGLSYAAPSSYSGVTDLVLDVDDLGNNGSGGAKTAHLEVPIAVGNTVLDIEALDEAAFEEEQDSASFLVTRTGSTALPLTFQYSLGGTASLLTDYLVTAGDPALPVAGTATIPAGASSIVLTVSPVNDGITEEEESITAALTGAAGAVIVPHAAPHTAKVYDKSKGLNATKKAEGTNHEAAHALATGKDVNIGVVESGLLFLRGVMAEMAQLGTRLRLNKAYLGAEFGVSLPHIKHFDDMMNLKPPPAGANIPAAKANDDHATRVADIIGSNDAKFTGVAKEADLYAVTTPASEHSRAALDFLSNSTMAGVGKTIGIYNMSWSLPYRLVVPAKLPKSYRMFKEFIDWFVAKRNALVVASAGNRELFFDWILAPGDGHNVISVGAVGADFKTVTAYSLTYAKSEKDAQNADPDTFKDIRSLPHILAPGGEGNSKLFTGKIQGANGTSFAAPAVAGIAALIAERQSKIAVPDLKPGDPGKATHLGYKAIILNSARKRFMTGHNSANETSRDHAEARTQPADRDYLKTVDGKPAVQNGASGSTDDWTPASWKLSEGNVAGKTYKAFLTDSPLDDDQGVGLADAKRALIQYNGGEKATSGKQLPGAGKTVTPIGWNMNELKFPEGDTEKPQDTYTFNFKMTKGKMITATLVWDANVVEQEYKKALDLWATGNGEIEVADQYVLDKGRGMAGTNGLADYRLQILLDDKVIAESGPYEIAENTFADVKDTIAHLHIPAPETTTEVGKYAIRVVLNRRAGSQPEVQPYALAWWVDDSA
ncbi:MAG: S8 family serine peptidase [Gemmataceae bacterium]|nr:S8 family serine peptidase [Gemmataceae bacterium]